MSRPIDPSGLPTTPITVRLTEPQARALGPTPAARRLRIRELADAELAREVPPCAR